MSAASATSPSAGEYDAVVIGTGIGGLSAAAMLASGGWSVLAVERQEAAGGYAHAFRRGEYLFDPAIHWTAQAGAGNLMDAFFRHLGVADRIRQVPVEHPTAIRLPDGTLLELPVGLDPFIEAHQRAFPQHAAELERYWRLAYQMHREVHQLSMSLGLRELDAAAAKFPTLFKYRTASLGEVLAEQLGDPLMRDVCAATWPYIGLPPSKGSFFALAQILMNQLEGCWYPVGSMQAIVDTLAAGMERQGGELLVGNGAARIVVADGAVTGVVLDGGEHVRTPVVISNADATATFMELVGVDNLPAAFARRLARMEASQSAFILFTATKADLGAHTTAHEIFPMASGGHEADYAAVEAGHPGGIWITVPTLADPSLAPEGEHVVIATSMAPYDLPWEEKREEYVGALLASVEASYPGYRDGLTFLESATPHTIGRFTGNRIGAAYGWANTPKQAQKRLPHDTPIAGLKLAGHWTQPGSGHLRVLASGIQTAQMVIGASGRPVPTFAEADLPAVGS